MSEQRNISTKKVLRFSVGLVLVVIFMVALVAASRQQNDKTVKGMEVHLNDDKELSFLQKKDIEALLLKNRSIDLAHTAVGQLDLDMMERIARTNPWVAKADIYVDNRSVLQVNILQREPVARIFDVNGASYYMDSTLSTMPVHVGYACAAPVFTNVPVLHNDSMNTALRARIAYMSKVIGRDSFWQNQITQVEVQPDQNFVLIPLFGNQRILAGDTSGMPEKLDHLMAFYKNVANKIGWDKYETLDVRFKGQVIASPSIGWVPPKVSDTASISVDEPATAPGAPVMNDVRLSAATPVAAQAAATVPAQPKSSAAVPAVKPMTTTGPARPKPTVARTNVLHPAKNKPAQHTAAAKKPVVAAHKPAEKKKETKQDKKDHKKPAPKYIYPGKASGNH